MALKNSKWLPENDGEGQWWPSEILTWVKQCPKNTFEDFFTVSQDIFLILKMKITSPKCFGRTYCSEVFIFFHTVMIQSFRKTGLLGQTVYTDQPGSTMFAISSKSFGHITLLSNLFEPPHDKTNKMV